MRTHIAFSAWKNPQIHSNAKFKIVQYFPICDITSAFYHFSINFVSLWNYGRRILPMCNKRTKSDANQFILGVGKYSGIDWKCLMCSIEQLKLKFWDFEIWYDLQIPQDRTIVRRVLRTVSLSLFVCMSTISMCGIVVAIALIVFNIWNNHRR